MKFISLFLLLCFSSISSGNDALSGALQKRALGVIEKLTSTSFPELKGVQFELKLIKNPAVFLATDIGIASIVSGPREYVLYLNKTLETHSISDLAFEGIMAHELIHFSDYEKMNAVQLAVFYAQYLSSEDFVASYERKTDLQAFERGYAIGIKAFRNWLYLQISEKDKVIKEKNYYTPEQIDEWLLSQPELTLL